MPIGGLELRPSFRYPRGAEKIYRSSSTMLAVRANGVYELQFPICKLTLLKKFHLGENGWTEPRNSCEMVVACIVITSNFP